MVGYNVIGMMSGTSLDGNDIVLCHFDFNKSWSFKILKAKTYKYSSEWHKKLSAADNLPADKFIKLHKEYGFYLGGLINQFLKNSKEKVDFIASHGHTVFHQPHNFITFQLGDGACIAAKTKITTISDFRSLDIALKGQGAPLVPIGDELLFNNYDYCLNLGGFANISFNSNNTRFAYDICPVNILINHFTRTINLEFDEDGKMAMSGTVNKNLLTELNNVQYYKRDYPKSLGREWLYSEILPVVDKYNLNLADTLRTIYEHIYFQINKAISSNYKKTILITGGGAYNKFLVSLLKKNNEMIDIILPENKIIDFKEAIIFALLGVLRYQNKVNCLSSVTGASMDCSGGVIYFVN
jgi:anhydro-N-acetylmuramic acid kinase